MRSTIPTILSLFACLAGSSATEICIQGCCGLTLTVAESSGFFTLNSAAKDNSASIHIPLESQEIPCCPCPKPSNNAALKKNQIPVNRETVQTAPKQNLRPPTNPWILGWCDSIDECNAGGCRCPWTVKKPPPKTPDIASWCDSIDECNAGGCWCPWRLKNPPPKVPEVLGWCDSIEECEAGGCRCPSFFRKPPLHNPKGPPAIQAWCDTPADCAKGGCRCPFGQSEDDRFISRDTVMQQLQAVLFPAGDNQTHADEFVSVPASAQSRTQVGLGKDEL